MRIEQLLARSRGAVPRPGPIEAFAAQAAGALIVDTRPEQYRAAEGEIPGSLVLERNVLEWRLAPSSPDRVDVPLDVAVVVVCNEGYASSLAAASLRALGVEATDLDGGFRAWRATGLPVRDGAPTPSERWVAEVVVA